METRRGEKHTATWVDEGGPVNAGKPENAPKNYKKGTRGEGWKSWGWSHREKKHKKGDGGGEKLQTKSSQILLNVKPQRSSSLF